MSPARSLPVVEAGSPPHARAGDRADAGAPPRPALRGDALREADLRGTDLREADLREADLPALLTAFYDRVGCDPAFAPYFARWLAAFEATVDGRYAGPDAERVKDLAHRIAYNMQLRLGLTPFAPLAPARREGT